MQNLKIGDLAPSRGDKQSDEQLLRTVDFAVYVFEIPADNISALDDIWPMLSTKPLQFNDYDSFGANLFSVGFGRVQTWDKIAALLRAAEAREIRTVSLLLPVGQVDDFGVTRLRRKQDIFYISRGGSTEGATVGPGVLSLRIKTKKITGSRGVCKVELLPVLPSPTISSIPQSAIRTRSGNLLFTSCGFKLKMSPGDFFFLGPVGLNVLSRL